MDRATAEKLMRIYARLNESLNEATAIIGAIPNQEEQRQLRRPVGATMQSVWLELMQPIVRQYPDLDPDAKPSRDGGKAA